MNRFAPPLFFSALLLQGLAVAAADANTVIERRSITRSSGEEASPGADRRVVDLGTLIETTRDYRALSRSRSSIIENSDDEDIAAFFAALLEDRRPPTLVPGQWHALVNDLFAGLLADAPHEFEFELAPALAELVREAPDSVIRDYALQHLAIFAAPERPLAQAKRERILDLLREAAAWRRSPVSGTALVNLYHLGDGVEDGALAERALAVAADPSAHGAARSTALQVGVLLKDQRFLAPAVQIARRSPIVAHRASAAHAIAAFGGPEQRTLLLQLRRRGPEPITNIANQALARIENDA